MYNSVLNKIYPTGAFAEHKPAVNWPLVGRREGQQACKKLGVDLLVVTV